MERKNLLEILEMFDKGCCIERVKRPNITDERNDNKTTFIRKLQSSPDTHISDNEKNYELNILYPGIKRDNLSIIEDNGKLKIEYKAVISDHPFNPTSFTKVFNLPTGINPNEIQSEYVDGILKVIVPKNKKDILKITVK